MPRPSLYRPEFCERVIEFGKQGMSLTEMAAELEITFRTMRNWELDDEKPDFQDAMQMARTYSQAWWESQGRTHITNPKFNAALYGKTMSARFPADWSDRQVTTLDATDAFGKLLEELNGRTRGLPPKAG